MFSMIFSREKYRSRVHDQTKSSVVERVVWSSYVVRHSEILLSTKLCNFKVRAMWKQHAKCPKFLHRTILRLNLRIYKFPEEYNHTNLRSSKSAR